MTFDDNLKEQILTTEYSKEFDEIRKNMMVQGIFTYGPIKQDYPNNIDAIASLEKRLELYKSTGNREFLADIANFAMIEFMLPRHSEAHIRHTDSSESCGVVGMGIEESYRFKDNM